MTVTLLLTEHESARLTRMSCKDTAKPTPPQIRTVILNRPRPHPHDQRQEEGYPLRSSPNRPPRPKQPLKPAPQAAEDGAPDCSQEPGVLVSWLSLRFRLPFSLYL